MLLCYYATVLLCYYVTMLLCYHTTILPYDYNTTLQYYNTAILLNASKAFDLEQDGAVVVVHDS